MGSKLKEEEKNEKAIRAQLRKGPNRRCINCNSLGPQYVCLTFSTFVCTLCSGIHREFTHRVKSVSMSKFTSQEVANLEAGGNELGREIFFKDWDPHRQPLPDSSNIDRLREFIRMVYVEKRFSGEKPLPHSKGGEREDAYENRRSEPRQYPQADSRSPPYEDRYEDRSRRSNAGYDDRRPDDRRPDDRRPDDRGGRFDERRSPARFDEKRSPARYDERRSPARFEPERTKYERNYNEGRRYEPRDRYPYEDRHNEGYDRRYEDRFANEKEPRSYNTGSPPPIRPVRDILGDDVPPLRVENNGKQTNGGQDIGKSSSSQKGCVVQRFGSSSSIDSLDANGPAGPPVPKREEPISLIDFSSEPDPPAVKEQIDPFGVTGTGPPAADNSTGWATFEPAVPQAVPQAPAVSPAQDILGAFSNPPSGAVPQGPAVSPAQDILGAFSNPSTNGFDGNAQWAQWSAPTGASVMNFNVSASTNANSWSGLADSSPSTNSTQAWNAFPSTVNEANSVPISQGMASHSLQTSSSSTSAPASVVQAQPSGRVPLPEDIFSAPVSSIPFAAGQSYGAPFHPPVGLGLMSQGSLQSQKSVNPFDLPGDSASNQTSGEDCCTSQFPSLSSMQSALPNISMGPRPMPNVGAYGSQWSQMNSVAPSQALYSSGFSAVQTQSVVPPQTFYPPAISAGNGSVFPHPPNVLSQAMQGSLGPLGANTPGIYTGAPSSKQGDELFFSSQSFQSLPSQKSLGSADSMYTSQGAAQISHHGSLGPASVGDIGSIDPFISGTGGQQRLLSHNSLGSLGNMGNMSMVDPLFPSQAALPGQRLVSHASLGSLSSFADSDAHFPGQAPSQFSTHPVGNPFG
ncbi:hypothetical protein KP509_33G052700 [Ceratopteris richardii]|uniref:Arf-GAP domain-containing protein n=1 Tax=Ceratopteris richardii TaxID=49495 RepID=A0A8T2QQT4_CERRI|nr:hypothetical protein KP509_33G052700 [Ceratopteris richardii]KAH7285957.1 hypothetical protein KP509_33G052700 [Ceratopteris richardii]